MRLLGEINDNFFHSVLHIYSFGGGYYVKRARTYRDIFYHGRPPARASKATYFSQEELSVSEETRPCYSQSVPPLTERTAVPLISLYRRFYRYATTVRFMAAARAINHHQLV